MKIYEKYTSKKKLNKIKIIKSLKPLRLYTHTHTHTGICHLVNKSNVKYAENIKVNITIEIELC